jgi:hypothetical protein
MGNGIAIRTGNPNAKTILMFDTMTSDFVRFTWTSNAFANNFNSPALDRGLNYRNYYEVWFDEGENTRPIANFTRLANNVAATGYTYRNFTKKYGVQDALGHWKVNYRFYVTAYSRCGPSPISNLLEVLVSIREKNQSRRDTGLTKPTKDDEKNQELEVLVE